MGKYLLRHAFADGSACCRRRSSGGEKAAFSDAVGHSMVDDLKAYAEALYTDAEFRDCARQQYSHCPALHQGKPAVPRAFRAVSIPVRPRMVADFWMPNRDWPGCDVDDPSARVLANYGDSGV